jgi:hypothetical protein
MATLTGPKRGPEGGLSTDIGEIEAMERYSIVKRVEERIAAFGITAPVRPTVSEEQVSWIPGLEAGNYFDGRLPSVIRRLSLDQLSELLGLMSGYYAYLSFVTNRAAAERSEALRKKEFLWSYIRDAVKRTPDAATGKRPTDQSASDAVRHDTRFVMASAAYDEANCVYETLNAMLRVTEQDMKVISREVTIQQMKLFDGFKGSNPMVDAARRAAREAYQEEAHGDMAREFARDFNPRPTAGGSHYPAGVETEGGPGPAPAPVGRPAITRRR